MNQRDKHIASQIRAKIREVDSHAKVVLYGSRARGTSGKVSDWDVLVLLDTENVDLKTEQKFRHSLFDLELEIEEPISVFVYSNNQWESKYKVTPFYKNVKREGIVL
jgi:predicted nucleotidyltransferase